MKMSRTLAKMAAAGKHEADSDQALLRRHQALPRCSSLYARADKTTITTVAAIKSQSIKSSKTFAT